MPYMAIDIHSKSISLFARLLFIYLHVSLYHIIYSCMVDSCKYPQAHKARFFASSMASNFRSSGSKRCISSFCWAPRNLTSEERSVKASTFTGEGGGPKKEEKIKIEKQRIVKNIYLKISMYCIFNMICTIIDQIQMYKTSKWEGRMS